MSAPLISCFCFSFIWFDIPAMMQKLLFRLVFMTPTGVCFQHTVPELSSLPRLRPND